MLFSPQARKCLLFSASLYHANARGSAVTALASQITVLDNLEAIPNRVNGFKKNVVRYNLTGKSYPGADTYYNFYAPAVQKYMAGAKGNLFGAGKVVDNVASVLSSAGNNQGVVSHYFTSYATYHYQGAIDFLSTWTGIKYTRTSSISSSTSSASARSTGGGTGVTCYHEADPQNTCAAIANGPGWCDCGDSKTYITQSTGQVCGWTTLPPTTSFDCIAPTSPPPPPAPTTTALACTLT